MRLWMLVSKESDADIQVAARNTQHFWNRQCQERICGPAFIMKTTLTLGRCVIISSSFIIIHHPPPLCPSPRSQHKEPNTIMREIEPPYLTRGITGLGNNSTLATYGVIF